MLVRMKIGKYAGEVRDIEPDAARTLIANGNAVVPTYGDATEAPEPVAMVVNAPPVEVPADKPKTRGKRK